VDIIESVTSIQAVDLLIFFNLFALFILGFMQGIIRRLLGIASILLSLLVAAQLQAPFGSFLAENWTQYPREYNYMLAFGSVFVAGSVAATVTIQLFFRPAPLFAKYPVIDELVGGMLGLIQGGLILAAFFLITDPFFVTVGQQARGTEFPFIREIHQALNGSETATIVRDRLIPSILALLGGVFPASVTDLFTS